MLLLKNAGCEQCGRKEIFPLASLLFRERDVGPVKFHANSQKFSLDCRMKCNVNESVATGYFQTYFKVEINLYIIHIRICNAEKNNIIRINSQRKK